MSDYRKFNEEVLREVKQECKKYNYCAELRFNEIHIQTKFESWYFVPNECGIMSSSVASNTSSGVRAT